MFLINYDNCYNNNNSLLICVYSNNDKDSIVFLFKINLYRNNN